MPQRHPSIRFAALAGAMLFASLLSCGREITGPDGRGGRPGALLLDPQFASIRLGGTGEMLSIGSVVEFDRVRVVLRRMDGTIAVDTLVPFPPTVESISLKLNITLDPQAPPAGEPLSVTMKYVNVAGDTVFSGGPLEVTAKPTSSGAPAPVQLPIDYVGVGANAKSITIAPTDYTGLRLDATSFTATVLDSSDAPLPLAPVAFTSTDSQRVHVNLRTGATTLLGARGSAKIIAQTLTGQADTALVSITPVATGVVLVSGGGQQTLQAQPFPQPVRVRAVAVDNIGVSGVDIEFTVLQGQGTVSQVRDTTDANGEAEVTWTAGDSAGTAILRAAIHQTAIGVNIGGTQLSDAANNLTFSAQPPNITAGNAIPTFSVVVRDVTGDTVPEYNSGVQLTLSGGTAGASLVGTTSVTALNGVAVFSGLTVDRAGTGYRIVASLPSLPAVPPLQSNTFNVAAAPPTAIALFSGGGQSATANTALADSIKFRVRDTFNYPVAGVTVSFSATAGGGTVSPTTAVTDANGLAATRWTVGPAGSQQLTATVSGLTPATATASVAGGGGGAPSLYLGYDELPVAIGRTRQSPVFLTNPTPSPLTVTLAMREPFATWSTSSVVIPAGGAEAFPSITGVSVGTTYAVASSAAGTDSVLVTVDSASATIDGYGTYYVIVGDTLRTLVLIDEPAGVGGVTVTVRSTDSSAVLVAPGTGGGFNDEVCYYCYDIRSAPATTVSLLAPPAGTAVITIPEGHVSAQLAVIPLVGSQNVALELEAPGLVGTGTVIVTETGAITMYTGASTLGVGQRSYVEMYRGGGADARRDVLVRVRSVNPAVATVDSLALIRRDDSYSQLVSWTGVGVGTTQLIAELDGFADTVDVTVATPRLYFYPSDGTSISVGARASGELYLGWDANGFFSYGDDPAEPVTVTFTSRDPGVAVPEFGSRRLDQRYYEAGIGIIGVGEGSTWIVYEAPGHVADSVLFTVSGGVLSLAGNTARIGAGQVTSSFYVQRPAGSVISATSVTLTSSDPNIVRVLTPTVTINQGYGVHYARLVGVSAGTAMIHVTAPGHAPDSLPFQVFPGVLFLNSYGGAITVDPDSASRSISASTTDGVYGWPVADTMRAVIRSTNPAVLQVTDSILTFSPNYGGATGGAFRAIAPGTAQLTIDAPGYQPDTTATITVRPPRLNFTTTTVSVGRGLRIGATIQRLTPTSTVLPLAFNIQGAAGSAVLAPTDSFPIGSASRTLTILGGANAGTDTLIASAPGMTPDTLLIQHQGTRVSIFGASSQMELGTSEDFVDVRFRNASTFATQAVRDTMRVRLFSRDTAVVRVVPDTGVILPGAVNTQPYYSVQARTPGETWLVTEHLNGSAAPESLMVTVRAPRLLISNYGPLVMGMQERTYSGYHYVQRERILPTAVWVRLESSAPGIVSVPDSVEIPANGYYAYFEVTSGDTTGSALITASADGYAPSGFLAFVTASSFEGYVDDDIAVGERSRVDVYRYSAGYSSFPSLVETPIRFESADPSIAVMTPDSASLPVGFDYYDEFEWLVGVARGQTHLTIRDLRPDPFARTLPASVDVEVRGLTMEVDDNQRAIHVAPGTETDEYRYVSLGGSVDSLWIRFQTVGGRAAPMTDSVLLQNQSYAYFGVRGISEGTDTLVISAAGLAPESLTVYVGKGEIRTENLLPTIRQGDSVQVYLDLHAADEAWLYASAAPLDLTLSSTANLQTTLGAGPVSTVQVAPGSSYAIFWVKALAPGGGTLTITHPAFLAHEISFQTRSP